MIDVSFKRFDELDSYGGQFLYAAKGLGVTAWGMNVLQLPANWDGYPSTTTRTGRRRSTWPSMAPLPSRATERSGSWSPARWHGWDPAEATDRPGPDGSPCSP